MKENTDRWAVELVTCYRDIGGMASSWVCTWTLYERSHPAVGVLEHGVVRGDGPKVAEATAIERARVIAEEIETGSYRDRHRTVTF